MTSAKEVFDLAITLMNENDDRTGETETQDTLEYQVRYIPLLNIILAELYPYSDAYAVIEPGKRPTPPKVEKPEQFLVLDDSLAVGVAPYGLAALLIVDDNASLASFFQQSYEQKKYELGMRVPAQWEDIPTVF